MNGCHYRLFSIVCGPPLSLAGPSLIKSNHVLRQCFANPWNTPSTLQEASMWLTAQQWLTLFSEPLALQQAAHCWGDFTWTHRRTANSTAIIACWRQQLVFSLSPCYVLWFVFLTALPDRPPSLWRSWTWHLKNLSVLFERLSFSFLFLSSAFPTHFTLSLLPQYLRDSVLFWFFFNVGWKSIVKEQSSCKRSLTGIPDLLTSTTLM